MNISDNKVVTIDYTLKDDSGKILDTSKGKKALSYIHGIGSIIPGLEKACEGKTKGDSFSVSINPNEAYGEYNPEMVVAVTKDKFEDQSILEVGMQFQTQTEYGIQIFSVLSIEGNSVKLDGNHPLAGKTLNFDVVVNDIRDATKEELEHKHIH